MASFSSVLKLSLPLFLALALTVRASEPADVDSVEELNRRYDDFFHQLHERERLDEQRQKHAGEVTKEREQHSAMMEKARKDYIKNKPKLDFDPRAEAQWLREQKAYKENQDMNRRRLVQKKHTTEETLKRGRKIPELKEHDLEGY